MIINALINKKNDISNSNKYYGKKYIRNVLVGGAILNMVFIEGLPGTVIFEQRWEERLSHGVSAHSLTPHW